MMRHFVLLPRSSDTFSDFLTRCVQEPALAQSLGSYTRLSLQERERWLSETVGETLHVDPAQINALRMYSSTTDFAKGVAKHVHSVLYSMRSMLRWRQCSPMQFGVMVTRCACPR